MGTFSIDLNNINLDNNFDQGDSDTIIIIIIRFLTWHIWLKALKNIYKWRINANGVAS